MIDVRDDKRALEMERLRANDGLRIAWWSRAHLGLGAFCYVEVGSFIFVGVAIHPLLWVRIPAAVLLLGLVVVTARRSVRVTPAEVVVRGVIRKRRYRADQIANVFREPDDESDGGRLALSLLDGRTITLTPARSVKEVDRYVEQIRELLGVFGGPPVVIVRPPDPRRLERATVHAKRTLDGAQLRGGFPRGDRTLMGEPLLVFAGQSFGAVDQFVFDDDGRLLGSIVCSGSREDTRQVDVYDDCGRCVASASVDTTHRRRTFPVYGPLGTSIAEIGAAEPLPRWRLPIGPRPITCAGESIGRLVNDREVEDQDGRRVAYLRGPAVVQFEPDINETLRKVALVAQQFSWLRKGPQ